MLLDYLLAALAFLAASFEPADSLPAGPAAAAAAGPASAAFTALVALAVGRSVESRMASGREWSSLVAFFARTLALFRAVALAAFVFAVHGAGFGAWVRAVLAPVGAPAVAEAAMLLPFCAGWAGSLAILHRVEGPDASMREFLSFRLRGFLALLLMLLAGGAAVEVLFLDGPVAAFMDANPAAYALTAALLLAGASAAVPLALRAMWTTSPLEGGAARDAISSFARENGFRFAGVRIWDTGGVEVVNAAVAGILPRLRYVFLTKALCERLDAREVVAVFAHEVGHVKCGHALGFFGLAAGWAGFFTASSRGPLYPGSAAAAVAVQCVVSALFAIAFLWFSRRFEGEADLFAARNLESPDLLCETLWKVAALNGDPGTARSLTHSSVGMRIEFIRRMLSDCAAARAYHRSNRILIALALTCGGAGLAFAAPALL